MYLMIKQVEEGRATVPLLQARNATGATSHKSPDREDRGAVEPRHLDVPEREGSATRQMT